MSRVSTRTTLLPAALLLAALAACAGGSPTGPGAPVLRRDVADSTRLQPATDSASRQAGNYENPVI